MSMLLGILYLVLVTVVGQLCFEYQANGSMIRIDNRVIGSELIGQYFNDDRYFRGRESYTLENPYNPLYPSASIIFGDREKRDSNISLYTSSGSGLDPHINIYDAEIQIPRIAVKGHIKKGELENLIWNSVENQKIQLTGLPYVNVLKLNIELYKKYSLKKEKL